METFIIKFILTALGIAVAIAWWRGAVFTLGDPAGPVFIRWRVYSLKKWLAAQIRKDFPERFAKQQRESLQYGAPISDRWTPSTDKTVNA